MSLAECIVIEGQTMTAHSKRRKRKPGQGKTVISTAGVTLPGWDIGAMGAANRVGLVEDKPAYPMAKETPSAKYLRKMLRYNPDTGDLIWNVADETRFSDGERHDAASKAKMFNSRYADKPFGALNDNGYRCGAIWGKPYKAHRLIFKIMTGREPLGQIDHINGIKDDNRWENLRDVSAAENSQNQKMRANNVSGVMGVSWFAQTKTWRVAYSIDGKKQHVGYFEDFDEAVKARRAAEARAGYHSNHGRPVGTLADLGLKTVLARRDMIVEDVVDIDPETGDAIKNPNDTKRARRVDLLDLWHRKGVLSASAYTVACDLRDAWLTTQMGRAVDLGQERVDSSPKPDHAVTIQIDRLSKFHALMRHVVQADVPVVNACVLNSGGPGDVMARDGSRPFRNVPGEVWRHDAGLRALSDALERLAKARG